MKVPFYYFSPPVQFPLDQLQLPELPPPPSSLRLFPPLGWRGMTSRLEQSNLASKSKHPWMTRPQSVKQKNNLIKAIILSNSFQLTFLL